MTDLSSNDSLIRSISLEDLQAYLTYSGWVSVESDNSKWLVYEGPKDVNDRPLEIVLVKNGGSRKSYEYYASAVNLLAALNEENPSITVARIKNYERDVFNLRHTSSRAQNSISLDLAARQIQGIRNLVRDATELESKDPIPYSSRQPSTAAQDMAKQYQFGHTFQGSFGISIESPLSHYPPTYKQDAFYNDLKPRLPIARRILERIVRGLMTANQAAEQKSDYVLVNNYHYGFNANMCKSILEISRDGNAEIEYGVLWSPTLPPSSDIIHFKTIRLNETAYSYIDSAQTKLEDMVRPDLVKVHGLVEDIRTTDNPFGTKASREIVIKWNNRPDGSRPVGIVVEVDANEYQLAHRAQHDWIPIQVEGEARYTGSKWVLENPQNLRLVDSQ